MNGGGYRQTDVYISLYICTYEYNAFPVDQVSVLCPNCDIVYTEMLQNDEYIFINIYYAICFRSICVILIALSLSFSTSSA